MSKQNVTYPYNQILFRGKKEWSTNTYCNVGEPRKHAKWKKTDTRGHVIWFHLYELSRLGKSIETLEFLI